MAVVDLRGREHGADVLRLLAAAQIHRDAEDALMGAPLIADEYAGSSERQLWGEEREGIVVGLVGVQTTGPGAGVVRDLAVAPSYRRRGLGRQLLDFLRTDADFSVLEGDTLEAAVPFYEACGFSIAKSGTLANGEAIYRFSWRRN